MPRVLNNEGAGVAEVFGVAGPSRSAGGDLSDIEIRGQRMSPLFISYAFSSSLLGLLYHDNGVGLRIVKPLSYVS